MIIKYKSGYTKKFKKYIETLAKMLPNGKIDWLNKQLICSNGKLKFSYTFDLIADNAIPLGILDIYLQPFRENIRINVKV